MIRVVVAFALSLAVMAPAFAQTTPIDPARALAAVAASKTGEAEGVFEFVVGSTGALGYSAYLNSAADYHDPANLTVELLPYAINALKAKLGAFPQDVLTGKRIRVKGVAKRAQLRSGVQTRIEVNDIEQIDVLDWSANTAKD